jgi:Streptomyces sporulation and cell division protein, SsgA
MLAGEGTAKVMDVERASLYQATTGFVRTLTWEGSIRIRLHYAREDPYAVQLYVDLPADMVPAHWSVAREVLADGLAATSGIGDVMVRPGPYGLLSVVLGMGVPLVWLLVPMADVHDFLRTTYQLVPRGFESQFMDLDQELGLWEAGPRGHGNPGGSGKPVPGSML